MIKSENEGWGFFGTTAMNRVATGSTRERTVAQDFDEAARAIMDRFSVGADTARDTLDTKLGRHIADQLMENETPTELINRLSAHKGWARDFERTFNAI